MYAATVGPSQFYGIFNGKRRTEIREGVYGALKLNGDGKMPALLLAAFYKLRNF